jgi:hypothetical protein
MKCFLILAIAFSSPTFAYNGRECDKAIGRRVKGVQEEFGGYKSISSTSSLGTSSLQFSSSWGPCSAIKENEGERYFRLNYDKLKVDIAKGGGEYLDAFFEGGNCSVNSKPPFPKPISSSLDENFKIKIYKSFQKEYEFIFSKANGAMNRMFYVASKTALLRCSNYR